MIEIIIIAALILFNGLLAMSEIALISARKASLAAAAKQGSIRAKTALKLAGEPDKFLSTIQIGITVIGILTGIYSGDKIADQFGITLEDWGVSNTYAHVLSQTIIVVAVTYFTLIFGELVPKKIGMNAAQKVATTMAGPMLFLSQISLPFVWILSKSTRTIVAMLGIKESETNVTEAEIKSMIEEGAKDGEVQLVEQEIVERVFMMGDLKVRSIMTHRTDIHWLEINATGEKVRQIVGNHMLSVYPVGDGTIDQIVGIVHVKDILLTIDSENFNLKNIMHQPVYVHESMSAFKVLELMKTTRVSQALVCDEFGGLEGMVTLKDMLEALVGAIEEPHEEPDIIERAHGEGWLIDAQCHFHDFLTYFDKEDLYETGQYNTVGGLVIEQLQHIPISGERVIWNQFSFEVVDMDGARIDKLLVKIEPNT